jgi:hypothetical protein
MSKKWTRSESNRRPHPCHGCALPIELRALCDLHICLLGVSHSAPRAHPCATLRGMTHSSRLAAIDDLEALLPSWARSLRAENKSPHTISAYTFGIFSWRRLGLVILQLLEPVLH